VPSIAELWWKPEHGRMRRLAARAAEAQGGASFVQVNAQVAARLQAHVLERARAYAPRSVVDAYAGVGGTALPLAASGATVFHAGTARDVAGELVADGGRVLGIAALGNTVAAARAAAYAGVGEIDWTGGFYRTDIAATGVAGGTAAHRIYAGESAR